MLHAEWIKLVSVRGTWVMTGVWTVVALLGALGLSFVFGRQKGTDGLNLLTMDDVTLSFSLTWPMMLAWASTQATSEYRFSTIKTSFMADSRRWRILVAKSLTTGAFAGFAAAVLGLMSLGVTKTVAPNSPEVGLATVEQMRFILGHGLVWFLTAIFAVGWGVLIRNAAGTVSLMVLWCVGLVESVVGALPEIGSDLARWMPFGNARNFIETVEQGDLPSWQLSFVVVAAWALVVLSLSCLVAKRRDA